MLTGRGAVRRGCLGYGSVAGGTGLRFDDMLQTVLARPRETASARIATWRQLVDILAQRRGDETHETVDAASRLLDELRPEIPREVRGEAASAIAGRRIPRRMMAYFAAEPAALS